MGTLGQDHNTAVPGAGGWQDSHGNIEGVSRGVCGSSLWDNIMAVATDFGVSQSWVHILALLFSSYMILAKLLPVSMKSLSYSV